MGPLEAWIERQQIRLGMRLWALWRCLQERIRRFDHWAEHLPLEQQYLLAVFTCWLMIFALLFLGAFILWLEKR